MMSVALSFIMNKVEDVHNEIGRYATACLVCLMILELIYLFDRS